MLASTLLLAACFWALGRALRGALVGVQAKWVAAGHPLAPFALTLRPVPTPAGEEVWYAAGASLWQPAVAQPGARRLRLGRWHALMLTGGRPRRRLGERERAAGGLLVVTNRRVLFRGAGRGRAAREDVPLADVAHLRLEGPVLVVERRSRPSAPVAVRVGSPASVARLVQAAAAASAVGARPGAGNARRARGY